MHVRETDTASDDDDSESEVEFVEDAATDTDSEVEFVEEADDQELFGDDSIAVEVIDLTSD